jgi:hypothetical protein
MQEGLKFIKVLLGFIKMSTVVIVTIIKDYFGQVIASCFYHFYKMSQNAIKVVEFRKKLKIDKLPFFF